MKRLLIVSPRFPPVNSPDHQRVRTSLPYFASCGWYPDVLAVTPETTGGVLDPLLLEGLPADINIYKVAAWIEERTRRLKFGHLDLRCLVPILREGTKLFSKNRYDLVYFSTTVFSTFMLGRFWKRRFKCKVVLDYQDPWYQDGNHGYDSTNAPGGWYKYRLSQALSRYQEKFALRAPDHIISTSDGYVNNLLNRYPWLTRDQFTVIPFGAAPRDYETVRLRGIRQKIFQPGDGFIHWTYVGRGGPDMVPVLAVLFQCLARLKKSAPNFTKQLRLHFVGTNYSPAERTQKVVEPIAGEWGVADLVEEHSERIPYFEALALMVDSDAVLLIGSVAADYTASKFFNCVLSQTPVLALFNSQSLVSKLTAEFPHVKLASFRNKSL